MAAGFLHLINFSGQKELPFVTKVMSLMRCFVLALLAPVGLFTGAIAQTISNDSYFYGDSPPVYPSPPGTGLGDWDTAYVKAKAMVAEMSLDDKNTLTYGTYSIDNGCAGRIPALDGNKFPGFCLQDAGNGVRGTDFVNAYPSGIHVGASWNKNATKQLALAMAYEFRTKGINVALGPVVGPMGRIAEGGRNMEAIAADPYLSGALGAQTVQGFRERGVINSVKHYIANEQETNRQLAGNVASFSANIDDKTMHEMYLWPFAELVHAGAGCVMCSYNRVNNSYACANSKMLNGLLKTELGFQGFVVSDWGAQHTGVASTLAGLDMAMPTGTEFWASNMIDAINNGSVPEARLDDMATRILAAWYYAGQDSGYPAPGVGMPGDLSQPHTVINAKSPDAVEPLLASTIEGHVLVKNLNNTLPFKKPQLISVFGYDAVAQNAWNCGGSSSGAGENQQIQNETQIVGGGSGANAPAYISSPFQALTDRARKDGTSLYWDFWSPNPTVSAVSDACIVFINAYSTEGNDRAGLHDDYSDDLVNHVATSCSNTIVVIHNAGIRLVDKFADNPHVTAIIFAHVPGQDSGYALTSILYGDTAPSGKLPYTVAKNDSDYGLLASPSQPEGQFTLFPQSNFSEGLLTDYRAFDANNIEPRYEFGFGLSYTTFSYSNLDISNFTNKDLYTSGDIGVGGATDLWDNLLTVKADVTNSGKVAGAEVAQLYIGLPGGAVKVLRGFEKVTIQPGDTTTVTFSLLRKDLSSWNVGEQRWKLERGDYKIYVGSSSRTLPLTVTLSV